MAIIDDIKCSRCDRKYSGVRSRCPYCGARRISFGKYSKDTDNARGKMLISILILAVFTVGAAIMLFSTPTEPVVQVTEEPTVAPEDDTLQLQGYETPTPTPVVIETPPPATVEAIAVLYGGNPLRFGNEFSQREGTRDNSFSVAVEPPGLDVEVFIESSNEEIFTVERVYGGAANGFEVYGVSKGRASLLVTAGEKELSVTVIIT